MIFGVICVEVSRKFSKNTHFWQKSISTQDKNFESISTEVPPNIPDRQATTVSGLKGSLSKSKLIKLKQF